MYGQPPTWQIVGVIGLMGLPAAVIAGLLALLAARRLFRVET